MKTEPKVGHIQKIVPFLWFEKNAEEAVELYVSLFKNSRIVKTTYYPKEAEEVSGMPAGSIMTVEFELEGQTFTAINGGPPFKFTPAISFVVNCETQQEIDRLWEKLTDGGKEVECGWLEDKYGLSWQIVPTILAEYLTDKDPIKAGRVMEAMLKMVKLDIYALKKAYKDK